MQVRYNPGDGFPLEECRDMTLPGIPPTYQISITDLMDLCESGHIPFLLSYDGKVMLRFYNRRGKTHDFKWFSNKYENDILLESHYMSPTASLIVKNY